MRRASWDAPSPQNIFEQLFWGVDTHSVWTKGQNGEKNIVFFKSGQQSVGILSFVGSVDFNRLSFPLFLFFKTVSLPAFFQYKGRLLWVTAHYNTISSPPNLMKHECACVCVCTRVCKRACGRACAHFSAYLNIREVAFPRWAHSWRVCPCCYLCLYLHLHML